MSRWSETTRTWNWWPYGITQHQARGRFFAAIRRLRHEEEIAVCKTLSGAKRACQQHARLNRFACPDCLGSGISRVALFKPAPCERCKGTGKQRMRDEQV